MCKNCKELARIVLKFMGGRSTDCRGELDYEACRNCKTYYSCRRQYELTDELEKFIKELEITETIKETV